MAKVQKRKSKSSSLSSFAANRSSSLGPAFFAVVAAIIILLLLSVFGSNYLSGLFHSPGSTDPFRAANLTFTVLGYEQIYADYGYNGPVSSLVIRFQGKESPWMKLGNTYVKEARVVVKRLSSSALPVGSVFYYDYATRGWRTAAVPRVSTYSSSCIEVLPLDLRGYPAVEIPIHYSRVGNNSYSNNFTVIFVPLEDGATCFNAQFPELIYNASFGPYVNQTLGRWSLRWNNSRTIVFDQLAWSPYPTGSYFIPQEVGFVSPIGSVFERFLKGNVLIKYVYDTRLS